jgi:hypothetical protein
MAITHRKRTVVLVGAVMLAAAPLLMEARAGAAKLAAAGVPVGPGAEFTMLSKGTTIDSFEITSEGPTQLEWAQSFAPSPQPLIAPAAPARGC